MHAEILRGVGSRYELVINRCWDVVTRSKAEVNPVSSVNIGRISAE